VAKYNVLGFSGGLGAVGKLYIVCLHIMLYTHYSAFLITYVFHLLNELKVVLYTHTANAMSYV